jgi:pyruvate dehydrogenase E2 component (dihydrolipoamide acetyltransferase)
MPRLEFHMPDVGEGLAEAEVVRWLVKLGDTVNENQPIAEVETDKAIVTMPAPGTGRVTELAVAEGERVKVGSLLLVMEVATAPAAAAVSSVPQPQAATPSPSPSAAAATVQASPLARKLAAERGVPLDRVRGTGPGGRITVEDVEAHRSEAPAKPQPAPLAGAGEVERIPLRGLRRRVAEAMVESARAIPHVCGFHELDAQELVSLRQRLKPLAEARGVRLSFLPFLVKASVAALQAHPYLNASLDEQEQVILLKKSYHIGIATATADGLMVPVIRGADRLGLLDIAREAERLAAAARARTIRPDELQGGTFTITNVGQAGGWFGTSIIRFPEVAILGAGRIEERPVVREGKVVARPILPLSLTFDHRVIDGDGALGFVRSLREKLESPESLLIGEPDFHAA